MSRRKEFFIGVIVLISVFSCWKVWANESILEKNFLFISVIPDGDKDISQLRDIIFDVAEFELEQIGYSIYTASSDSDTNFRQGELDTIFQNARQKYASSLILIKYAIEDDNAFLTLSLFDVGNETEKASITMSNEIDLSFDRAITESVRELIETSGISPPAVSEITEAAVGSDEIVLTAAGRLTHPAPAEREAYLKPEDSGTYSEMDSRRFLFLSTGFAPFLAVGDAASYFSLGMEPVILLHFLFNAPVNFLQIGILLRATQFTSHGLLLETENYLLSAGPDIRFSISPSSRFNVYLHAAGGPSGFILTNEKIGTYWKFIPFVSGGAGVSYRLSGIFGIEVNIDYSVYFEKSIFIMGVSPSINTYVNL